MRILVVSQYFYPENFRINDVCFQLVKEGHDVTVLTGLPNYPEGKIKSEYRFFRKRKEIIDGVKVVRVPLVGRGNNKYRLMLNYMSFAIMGSLRAAFFSKFDVVYSYEVSPITQVIPAFFARKRQKLIVNCLDLWPESITAIGMRTEGHLYNVIKRLSSWVYRKADTILIPSLGFEDYLVDVCAVKKERIQHLPNHAEKDYLSVTEKKVFSNGKMHFLFAGNIGRAQNLDIIVDALAATEKSILDSIIVDIVGDGSYLQELKKKVEDSQLNHTFVFHGRCDLSEVIKYYEMADACLMTLEPSSFVSKTVPAKLQGYMASGRMILAAVNGSAAEIINDSKSGLVVNGDDVSGFAEIITQFVQNREQYINCGTNGRIYFLENYTLENHITKLLSYLEEK